MLKLLKIGGVVLLGFIALLWTIGSRSSPNTSPTATPQPSPIAQSQPTAIAKPTEPPAAPKPTAPPFPTAGPAPLVVANTGADGVSIRKAPGDGERIKVWNDGATMLPLGDEQEAAGRKWTKVRDPDGNEGWVASEFLTGPVTVNPPAIVAPPVVGSEPPPKPATQPAPGPQQASPKVKGPSLEVAAYLSAMQPKMELIGRSLTLLGQQSSKLTADASLLRDPTFRVQTAFLLATLQTTGGEIQNHQPVPAAARDVHTTLSSLGEDMVYISKEYAGGLDQLNAARIGNAVERLNGVPPKTALATEKIRRLDGGQ